MGKENAARMLGPEGWTPTAAEAKAAGFVEEVVPHDKLLVRAQEVAEKVNKIDKTPNTIAIEDLIKIKP